MCLQYDYSIVPEEKSIWYFFWAITKTELNLCAVVSLLYGNIKKKNLAHWKTKQTTTTKTNNNNKNTSVLVSKFYFSEENLQGILGHKT